MDKSDVKIISETLIYQGFVSVKRYLLAHKLFNGGWGDTLSREIVVRRNAAGLLPYDPALDKIVMIEQFRAGALEDLKTPWMIEVVAGIKEAGETAEALVIREAREEAGLEVLDLMPIANYWTSPGGSTEYMSLFCGKVDASGAGGIYGLVEEGEDIRVHVMDADQAFQSVRENKVNNAMSIMALMWLELNRERLKRIWAD
ncbi:MAG: nudF [Gammaproteobacteria bacterium]|jgi:ADP-ribose pyrophosphatase|nr:nudF [Gammaproteobacteria bacterium]